MGWFGRGAISALFFFVLFLDGPAILSPAHAASESAKTVFRYLNHCAKTHEIDDCRPYVTADSIALYDRFNGYGLASCLPEDTVFVSQAVSPEQTTIRAKTTLHGKTRFLRLIFSKEENAWKLDIPASLARSMGEKWQQQVAFTEALYVALRQQMGGKLDCTTVRSLAK